MSCTTSYPKLKSKNSSGDSAGPSQSSTLRHIVGDDGLGISSVGIYLEASWRISSASSCPALLKICIRLARLRLIFSYRASLTGTSSFLAPQKTRPSATLSSIPCAPPCPWSGNCQSGGILHRLRRHSRGNMGWQASPAKTSLPRIQVGIGSR